MLSEINTIWDLLWDVYEKTKGTAWEWILSAGIVLALGYLAVKFVINPLWKYAKKLYEYIQKKRFASKQIYKDISFMESCDVYEAITRYIPTRFSRTDPSNYDEPTPEYVESGAGKRKDKAPLLLEQFVKYEYSVKYGQKYYLCLGDCGMGKTTFLLNLYYQTSKLKQYKCAFIHLQESGYLEKIQQIEHPEDTILMLDALDENDKALANYNEFITELENATVKFARVIMTARTNFFENAAKERLSGRKSASSMSSKISNACKYYIMPFTDEDIQQYLKMRYPRSRKKQKQAWNMIENNKNLSVRPMLLKFMDPLLEDGVQFEYDFQLYEYLFEKWIQRECGSLTEAEGKKLYEECLLVAKAIYYQWMKNGRTGVYPHELTDRSEISGLASVKLKGHALLNRTSDGMYKFSHKSYWEYLLAKLALSDMQFANDLLIGNFDRAVGFLEEMINYRETEREPKNPGEKVWYTKSGRLFTSYEASLGIADYDLKYKKPEDAEAICKDVLACEDCSEELRLFAMVKLARSYWQQVKYQSAGRLLKEIDGVIAQEGFQEEWLYIYVEFAQVYADYSHEYKIKAGQDFLDRLLAFYEEKGLVNYGLLRCYESYCRCCMNYKQKYDCLNRMQNIAELYFRDDQYGEYCMLKAESWKMQYSSERLLPILKKMMMKYRHFMDMYGLLVHNCDMAKTMYVYHSNRGSFDENEDETLDYLVNVLEICDMIYENTESDSCHNPYSLWLWWSTAECMSEISVVKMNESAGHALQYIKEADDPEERKQVELRIRKMMGKTVNLSYEERIVQLEAALELAESTYWKASICWNLWSVKDGLESQKDLKKAYEYVISDPEFYLSSRHSDILRLMLEFYSGKLDRAKVAEDLLLLLPQIYGTTKPEVYGNRGKKFAYEILADFYKDSQNRCLIEIYTGLLECRISEEYLIELYDACIQFHEQDRFANIISTVIQNMEPFTKEDADALEKFLSTHEKQLNAVTVTALRSILKTKRKEFGGYRYDIF